MDDLNEGVKGVCDQVSFDRSLLWLTLIMMNGIVDNRQLSVEVVGPYINFFFLVTIHIHDSRAFAKILPTFANMKPTKEIVNSLRDIFYNICDILLSD